MRPQPAEYAAGSRLTRIPWFPDPRNRADWARAGSKLVRSPNEGAMTAHRRRTRATGGVQRVPPNKGRRYPADPPTVDEIVAGMRQAGDGHHGRRMRGLAVVLWRAGLRIHEALTLIETDLNKRRGSLLIRHGKGDRRREIGMDPWAWSVLASWTADRAALPPGPLFCVIDGPTRGRPWSATAVRGELRHLALGAAVRRRFAPHQLRHAHAIELLREGIPLPLIQRQLGHAYLSTTGTYLEGISSEEIIGAVHGRKAPMMHASTGLHP